MACKLTKSLDNKNCEYAVAGARDLFLANYYPPVVGAASVAGAIAYTYDTDGYISTVLLPTGESFYKINGSANTVSFTDALLAGANGAKYRQHTVNAVLNQYDLDVLGEADAISLGRFIAVVVDNSGRSVVLGRTGGLTAPAGGFDYASGAAEADATGWTVLLQGSSTEVAPILLNEAVITPVDPGPEIEE